MKKILRALSTLLSLNILFAFLMSCSSGQRFETVKFETGSMPSQKVKIRFISSWGGADPKAGALQEILDRFVENNPEFEVINESMFGEDFLHKIKTDFASGNNPDVFGLWPGSDIRALVQAGKVAELTEILDKDALWKGSFGERGWEYTTFDGKVYGLPLEIIYECLFINRDIFDKYDVKVPKDYEELKAAVKAFKSVGIVPIAYNSMAEGTYLYQNIVARLGGKAGAEKPIEEGKINDCYVNAMNYVKELYGMGAFPEGAFKMTSRDRNELFVSKRAAMIVQGSWFLGSFDKTDTTVDIIPFPYIEGGKSRRSSLIFGMGNGVFHMSSTAWADAAKKNAALKLMKTLTSKETASLLSERTGMISNVDVGDLKTYNGQLKKNERVLLESAEELIGPPDSFVDRNIWEGTIVKDFPFVLEGEKSAEALWEDVKKKYEELDVY